MKKVQPENMAYPKEKGYGYGDDNAGHRSGLSAAGMGTDDNRAAGQRAIGT